MRISTDSEDPGHAPWARGSKVFFNGAEVRFVFTADEEERLIVQAELDERGRVQIDRATSGGRKVTRYGEVRIELPEGVVDPRTRRGAQVPPVGQERRL